MAIKSSVRSRLARGYVEESEGSSKEEEEEEEEEEGEGEEEGEERLMRAKVEEALPRKHRAEGKERELKRERREREGRGEGERREREEREKGEEREREGREKGKMKRARRSNFKDSLLEKQMKDWKRVYRIRWTLYLPPHTHTHPHTLTPSQVPLLERSQRKDGNCC